MKNTKKGFIVPVLLAVVALLVIGGGAYFYFNNVRGQNENNLSITDPKDVKDYDTCMSYAKNPPTTFDIVFAHGSDIQEVNNFVADFKTAYPRAELTVSSEQDYLNEAILYNGRYIRSVSAMDDYKKGIIAQATSKISVTVPINDLGSFQSFSDFISATLKKYANIKFQQYAGSSPENTLSGGEEEQMQKPAEQQCDYKYNKLSASDRASLDIQATDRKIQSLAMTIVSDAFIYYQDHNYTYAPGPLSMDNGVCLDTGIYGIKKTIDAIKDIAGAAYCYASKTAYAVSAPLKSTPTTGYCVDYTGYNGITLSPTAASKGYCLEPPKEMNQDISACKNSGTTARERWICVGNMVNSSANHISEVVMPFATPVSQKIDFCKTFKGIEADYCFSSIVKAGYGFNVDGSPDAATVCKMVSNKNSWFKDDCISKD